MYFEDVFFYTTKNGIYLRGSGLLHYELTLDDGHESRTEGIQAM